LVPAALALAALAPAAADGHVTLQPDSVAAGDFTVLNVRVPNETENAATVKVEVQMPPGFTEASYEPVLGWKVKVGKEKLATPVKNDEGATVTEQVSRITWTGDGNQGKIDPGQFIDFPLSVQVPGKAGDTLTFKTLQTYDDGKVVRWIGPPNADEPAPQVKVTAASDQSSAAPAASTGDSGDDEDASKGLGIAALVVGGLALLLAGLALARSRAGRTG
jgi:uncharacterized protein